VALVQAHFPHFIPISLTVSFHQCSKPLHPSVTEAVYSSTSHTKDRWILQKTYFLNFVWWQKRSHVPKSLYFNSRKAMEGSCDAWTTSRHWTLDLPAEDVRNYNTVQGLSTFLLRAGKNTLVHKALLKPYYLSRNDHNQKIRTRNQRTDAGKYSFVNRTIKNWNQLSAGLLASFPCKVNTFRKRVMNVVTSKRIQMGFECK
jgi:hypothetical protein